MYEFEWDEAKADYNTRTHGVSFAEAASVFDDPLLVTVPDDEHSDEEDRGFSLGHSSQRRLLAVSWTLRGEETIRIISARLASPRERRTYSEQP